MSVSVSAKEGGGSEPYDRVADMIAARINNFLATDHPKH